MKNITELLKNVNIDPQRLKLGINNLNDADLKTLGTIFSKMTGMEEDSLDLIDLNDFLRSDEATNEVVLQNIEYISYQLVHAAIEHKYFEPLEEFFHGAKYSSEIYDKIIGYLLTSMNKFMDASPSIDDETNDYLANIEAHVNAMAAHVSKEFILANLDDDINYGFRLLPAFLYRKDIDEEFLFSHKYLIELEEVFEWSSEYRSSLETAEENEEKINLSNTLSLLYKLIEELSVNRQHELNQLRKDIEEENDDKEEK